MTDIRMYGEIADWWPILSDPADYDEEASIFLETLTRCSTGPLECVLELGCGGGNNASHLKAHFEMTLVDLSPDMLDVSRALNPECEHVEGDMRTVRLDREFDAVFVHDAVMYMLTDNEATSASITPASSGSVAIRSTAALRTRQSASPSRSSRHGSASVSGSSRARSTARRRTSASGLARSLWMLSRSRGSMPSSLRSARTRNPEQLFLQEVSRLADSRIDPPAEERTPLFELPF